MIFQMATSETGTGMALALLTSDDKFRQRHLPPEAEWPKQESREDPVRLKIKRKKFQLQTHN